MIELDYEALWARLCASEKPAAVIRQAFEAQLAEVQTEALPGERDRLIDRIAERDATIARLEAEVGRLRENAKANNQLARMYKKQSDEFRAKYVTAIEGANNGRD